MGTRNQFSQTSDYGNGVTATSSTDVVDANDDRGAVYNSTVDLVRALVTGKVAAIFTEFNITGDVSGRDAQIEAVKQSLS